MLCCFGCPSIEDAHHIFVHCPSFNTLRDEYSTLLISDTSRILHDTNLPPSIHSYIDCVTKHVFTDHSSWPLASSHFYLGILPPLTPDSPPSLPLSSESSRVLTRIAQSCHIHSIRLAARIWGHIIQHHRSASSKPVPKRSLSSTALLQQANLSLPPHLHYLLSL